ncbi:unnamed protein product [Schistocephalus solidus]|uniref:FANCI_S2 domain-containing protein n=1 Tax=Schistocephalus solidus TaxID=70667 RepID=A0A183S8D2_SCHSO|nr:unnamed protein product [Schistocephalus solidus]
MPLPSLLLPTSTSALLFPPPAHPPIPATNIELLAELAALCPFELTESAAAELENLLDGLAILPLELASAVLQAFLPLFTVAARSSSSSSSSSSSLMNVDVRPLDAFLGLQARVVAELRSMSTSFRVRVRRIAVAGFVKLLKNLKVSSARCT